MEPEVMIRQVEGLAGDLRTLTGRFERRVDDLMAPARWAEVRRVYLTGDGDSYHAARATEMAFESIGGADCAPMSALRFVRYGAEWMRPTGARDTLVIAISASGRTEQAVAALRAARRHGAPTVAVTGTPGSAVTRVADHTLLVDLPDPEPSPGIRTYQASVLGLLLIAIQLGEAHRADALRGELVALADPVRTTVQAIGQRCRQVADVIADAPVMVMTGSGPSFGTALFAAAKVIEASGVFAAGQDLEEWCHVERFAHPSDMPLFVIAPPGRSLDRAAGLAAQAHELGRRVIAVTHHEDTALTGHTDAVLPVHGRTREEFTPLLYHPFASHVAAHLARRLGRLPFQADLPRR
ncbi:SIS domain-containing protein [Pseudonocardia acaciae]|uniref:SIS domain-containing protein n=1 Tax=Pseudonocardia acaciae TaxID=551276 RepID=UPI00049222F4|nr:SIS domain-containing protein [Pseudonocardia acaciae]